MRVRLLLGLLPLLALGCTRPQPDPSSSPDDAEQVGPAWFEDVTDRLGIHFVHDPGRLDGTYPEPQIIGSGCALFDLDGDGRLDLYFVNNGGPQGRPNVLYRQKDDGTFENISKGSGLDYSAPCMGVAVGDIDNDGLPDVLVTQANGARLFRNRGAGKFEDVTKQAGIDNPVWATAAAFLDFDRDGHLDLVVVNYVDFDPTWECSSSNLRRDYCSPNVFPSLVSRLFRNLGKKGAARFEDVTESSGLGKQPGPGLGVVCADFDGDGWIDIFIANDAKPNHLWINQKNGTFKEEAVLRGVAFNGMGQAQSGMGVGLADVDGDGLFDLFITHLTIEQHTLWKQGPRGLFRDRSADAKLTSPRWRGTGFGTALSDFNHDGWPDVIVAHGRVSRSSDPPYAPLGEQWGAYAERNQLLANDGAGRFRDISPGSPALCGVPNVARGLAVGDIDGDGAQDVVLTTVGDRARVLRNVVPNRGHWLAARLLESTGKRPALGAEAILQAGGRRQPRVLRTADSYLSSSDPVAHFGLGQTKEYDELLVDWPAGVPRRERFAGGKADQVVVLRQGSGQAIAESEKRKP